MKSLIAFYFVVFASLCTCSSAGVIVGPYDDFQAIIDPSPAVQRKSTGHSHNGWDLKDSIAVVNDGTDSVALRAAAYASSNTPDFSGDVLITTIYGLDVVPGAEPLRVGGFDPTHPQIRSFFGETIIGNSGTEYPSSSSSIVSLANLATALPGYDLSPFEGAPNSTFYVFQTAAPGADLSIVPEPASLVMAVLGAATLALRVAVRRTGGASA